MKRTREQLKGELMGALEAAVERLLDWHEGTATPNLTQIEDEILQLRQEIGERLSAAVLADQAANQPSEPPRCADCGERLRYKGQKKTMLGSRLGELALARGYYYCARCDSGFFPPRPAA